LIKDSNPRCSIVEISALDTTRDSAFGATGKLHVAETGAGRILGLTGYFKKGYSVLRRGVPLAQALRGLLGVAVMRTSKSVLAS